ncbi:putative cytosolic iron-sulfur protein assembly protein 1 [Abortiporus biennis]
MTASQLPATINPVADLAGHDDRAWYVAWNPTKPILASCSADKSVRLYSYREVSSESEPSTPATSLKFSHNTTIPTGHTKTVRAIAWSPSGKTLATASFDSNIGIWEQEEGGEDEGTTGEWECMSLLEGHETECKSVAYSSTGTLLASCSRDKTVWIWEVHPDADFECMGVLMEHTQDVKCVAWHPTQEILASASYDDTIKLYLDDPSDDWYCAETLKGHDSTVWSLAWEPSEGRYLASGSDDSTIRIWRVTPQGMSDIEAECAIILEGHGKRPVQSLSWSKGIKTEDGSLGWLASAGSDGCVIVWEIKEHRSENADIKPSLSYRILAKLEGAHDVFDVNCVSWCPRRGFEDVLATAGDDGHVKVWRIAFNA